MGGASGDGGGGHGGESRAAPRGARGCVCQQSVCDRRPLGGSYGTFWPYL